MTYMKRFEADEAKALADLDSDLQAITRTSPERRAAADAAQQADLAASDTGRQQREAARRAAIGADAELRTGKRGRPPQSDARISYRSLVEAHDEAADIYAVVFQRYATVIEQLKTAGPELDSLQAQADEQVALARQTVQHLADAAETFAVAVALADNGKAAMARLGELVAFSDSPFIDLAAGPRELHDLHKRWAMRLDGELARLGVDPAEALAAQRQRRTDADYKIQLTRAADEFRKTGDGRRLWQDYRKAAGRFDEAQAEKPTADLSGVREQVRRLLTAFYKAAADNGGLEFQVDAVPII